MATAAPALTRDGTEDRVYGGDPNLIHIPDGQRREAGRRAAAAIDFIMRAMSNRVPWPQRATKLLCPGCYMILLFNAAVALAKANGQPLSELGRTMSAAFARLSDGLNEEGIEEIAVLLDPED